MVIGGTNAFFSDTETSSGNTFAAGAIDLKVDNESYYNQNVCAPDANDIDHDTNLTEYVWQGSSLYPVPGTDCTTSWGLDDLSNGHLFFNFTDLKPDDDGEDTISLHVQNDAWACMDLTLTSNDDASSNEPELDVPGEVQDNPVDKWDGELAQALKFVWWADDGDNVLEDGEKILSGDGTVPGGIESLYDLGTAHVFSVALADSQGNVWDNTGPMKANAMPYYIGKAWCFGTMALAPVANGQGVSPSVNAGVTCDGSGLGNGTQTDEATLDVQFRAMQARHNANFLCNPVTTGTIVVRKAVEPGNDPTPADQTTFAPYEIDGNAITLGVPVPVAPGPHTVTETNNDPQYQATFTLDCAPSGVVNVVAGEDYECSITNTYIPQTGTITITKVLSPAEDPGTFDLQIDNSTAGTGSNVGDGGTTGAVVVGVGVHTIGEIAHSGTDLSNYTPVLGGDADCVDGNVDVSLGENVNCTITNTRIPQCTYQVGANLVTNGGFEVPEVTHASNWDIFPSPVTGWNVEWRGDIPASYDPPGAVPVQSRPNPANIELHEGVVGPAFEGNQYVELDSDWGGHAAPDYSGEPASASIYQDIATTAGATYQIKYVWAPRPGTTAANNRLEVQWNNVVVDDTGTMADPPAAGIQWIERTVQVTATGATTRLRLTDRGTADSLGTFVDKVQVYQISCPGDSGPQNLLSDSFGTGSSANDIPNWDEEGADSDSTTNAQAAGSGQESASANGDRFARIGQDEWICSPVTTTGNHGLLLSYFWRGDDDAEPDDFGYVEYATGGTCASATWTSVAAYPLDADPSGGEVWNGAVNPVSVGIGDGATLIRFRQDSDSANENFRVDGISLTGIPN
jgi:predicted ribosomally synthesized peptide with SipW-like signal peptide